MRDKNLNVVIFGASVSAQSKEDSVWNWLKQWEKSSSISVYFSRVTYPSAFMSNAGLQNIDHVIALKPDIVVLDWLSTEEQDCQYKKISYIYESLVKRGIYVITAAFVRLDTWDRITPQYKYCLMASISHGLSFLDFTFIAKNRNLNWDDITRDGVHTNEFGAELYGNYLKSEIVNIYKNGKQQGEVIYSNHVDSQELQPFYFNGEIELTHLILKNELTIEHNEYLELVVYPIKDEELSIWVSSTIGPYTHELEVLYYENDKVINEESLVMRDEWCHFERIAFKPLALNIPKVSSNLLTVRVRPIINPDKGSNEYEMPKLRIQDRLTGLNCSICGIRKGQV